MGKPRPGTTPESIENEMIALALEQAKHELENKTASSQVVIHYLKASSTKNALEKKKLEAEVKVSNAKAEQLESIARVEELYEKAIDAMSVYGGHADAEEEL